jgi:hypothetical protein
LPNIRTFVLNEQVGENLLLKLYGLKSKAYGYEASTKPEEAPIVKITKFIRSDLGIETLSNHIGKEFKKICELRDGKVYWEYVLDKFFNNKYYLLINLVN